MTPFDAQPHADEIGAPQLCTYHLAVIASLTEKDHVGDRDSERVAAEMRRQCCGRPR
jgi:hypothetical protein